MVEIGTTLVDAADGDHMVENGTVGVVDTVEYEGFVAGETYTVHGTIMDKSTGLALEDSEGNRANVDDALPPDELTIKAAKELLASPNGQDRELGLDSHNHRPIVARNGRFGPYVTEVLDDDEATEVVESGSMIGKVVITL